MAKLQQDIDSYVSLKNGFDTELLLNTICMYYKTAWREDRVREILREKGISRAGDMEKYINRDKMREGEENEKEEH